MPSCRTAFPPSMVLPRSFTAIGTGRAVEREAVGYGMAHRGDFAGCGPALFPPGTELPLGRRVRVAHDRARRPGRDAGRGDSRSRLQSADLLLAAPPDYPCAGRRGGRTPTPFSRRRRPNNPDALAARLRGHAEPLGGESLDPPARG